MASVHERLYESPDLTRVAAPEYFDDLVSTIRTNFSGILPSFDVSVSCDDINLALDIALPCGLIVTELVSNCFKHAFPPGREGEPPSIVVSILATGDGRGSITVADNGIGIGVEKLEGEASTVGLVLIRALAAQLRGEVSWSRLGGTIVTVDFPL